MESNIELDEALMDESQIYEYLNRILQAVTILSQAGCKDSIINVEYTDNKELIPSITSSGIWYIDQIARRLLDACQLDTITSSTNNLPQHNAIVDPNDLINYPGNNDDDEEDWLSCQREYKRRRIDYIRVVLRSMKPIAIDVAAHICAIVQSNLTKELDTKIKTTSNSSSNIPSFILFSIWLPIAPHMHLLVSEMFQLESFVCPFISCPENVTDECRWIIAEAANHICNFYCDSRQECSTIHLWWDWSPIFQWMKYYHDIDSSNMETNNDQNEMKGFVMPLCSRKAIQWHAARAFGYVLNLTIGARTLYFKNVSVNEENVQWMIHPWIIDEEENITQNLHLLGKCRIWNIDTEYQCPGAVAIRKVIPLHQYLVEVGDGCIFMKPNAINNSTDNELNEEKSSTSNLFIRTKTTEQNLSLIGSALCIDPNPPPILICGPNGAGKSSLVREVSRLFYPLKHGTDENLLEIHVDDETDIKTLIGSYIATDIPGEFEWRAGALTQAARTGKWILIENMNQVSYEIQASLVKLFADRILQLGNGKIEKCHPNFRIFGTITTIMDQVNNNSTRRSGGRIMMGAKRPLHSHLWREIYIEPIPMKELKEIISRMYDNLPALVVQSVLEVFRKMDRSGRESSDQSSIDKSQNVFFGRDVSVRDLIKVISRISHTVHFDVSSTFITESQRTLCFAESYDVFMAACPDVNVRRQFIQDIGSPAWGITAQLAMRYIETRSAPISTHPLYIDVGRARIHINSEQSTVAVKSNTFAQTNYALRLMESIGVCVRENEPVLLVGETGTGKTTILQELAKLAGREMIAQNLSLQTDSADLLGGYKPLKLAKLARNIYEQFIDLFTGTFSQKQNIKFLEFAAIALQKEQWKKLSQCFIRASQLGLDKVKQNNNQENKSNEMEWIEFRNISQRFEQQRLAASSGPAFAFVEGVLVDAIRTGKWILLDEINLASTETLQRICGLLDDSSSSLTLTERGDSIPIERHPSFRLFAAMNPATDVGKKDLSVSVRSRFTEMFVDDLRDPLELRLVASNYISRVLPASDRRPECTDTVINVVDLYCRLRDLAESSLVDSNGLKPRYTLRTLSRALAAAKSLVLHQKLSLDRALYEGFELAFQGSLDETSIQASNKVIRKAIGSRLSRVDADHPGKRPRNPDKNYVLIKPFWIETGMLDCVDWAERLNINGCASFILTDMTRFNLRRLARAIASGSWPILLEGPTSAGKTSLVEYVAARCGYHVVRINNHEHTDIQEYTGSFVGDSNGSLTFQDGLLVRALKQGHWVILDELNLAPSDVLEALNRLLDANQELYIAEINETVKPHPSFRLFATQNPSGVYGGRKPLSRAFRNRFIEIHVNEIPSSEMITILEKRCGAPASHAKILVEVLDSLRVGRSKSGIFLGKDGFISPRDLLRWAERKASSKQELAREGFMLLAERLRTTEERNYVKLCIERHLKTSIDEDSLYYGQESEARSMLLKLRSTLYSEQWSRQLVSTIADTKSMLRLLTLVLRAIKQNEPVLLVGDTGCGKTVSIQLLSLAFGRRLHIVNCHQTTETSDLIGGMRPVRGRSSLAESIAVKAKELIRSWPDLSALSDVTVPDILNEPNPGDVWDEHIESILSFCGEMQKHCQEKLGNDVTKERSNKRPKLLDPLLITFNNLEHCAKILQDIDELSTNYRSIFNWSDGPLVKAMKVGEMILLDEISLADDAVLERLNSVLEPSRTIVLAEKGGLFDDCSITAHSDFQFFATMNPGGDFGKRELSPALRSRFTEIWVPPISDLSDISKAIQNTLKPNLTRYRDYMLDYVQWFNEEICVTSGSSSMELTLSLRDILSWAAFVDTTVDSSESPNGWEFYVHGARLMHLDGIGLGTTIDNQLASSIKDKAELFLLKKMAAEGHPLPNNKMPKFGIVNDRFGSDPFWISCGKVCSELNDFNLAAPTTATNVNRILRGMQLRKPILLEGPPAAGKTATIVALASASGHKLVRINLSEQTEMSDLLGGDFPQEKAGFHWCDGVLLTAIKNGDWVLLDELNLASQSVLEGLNSCLDHRSTIYIPELGKEFPCPPTFRVFAAQNPLAQGGGRKGLPKSFLNRFTKVYVDALSDSDLRLILASQYPNEKQSDNMIAFNRMVQTAVADTRIFGHNGAPWEFNLRDIFRWCELLTNSSEEDTSYSSICARDLYFQRFRCTNDRYQIKTMYDELFRISNIADIPLPAQLQYQYFESHIEIRDATIDRQREFKITRNQEQHGLPSFPLPLELYDSFEAIARCVSMKWPCLIVESCGDEKDSIIRGLGAMANATIIEIALSNSSDVSELVGCYEQVDSNDEVNSLVSMLEDFVAQWMTQTSMPNDSDRMQNLLFKLRRSHVDQKETIEETMRVMRLIDDLLEHLLNGGHLDKLIRHLRENISSILNRDTSYNNPSVPHFTWKDGALVQALRSGYWVHLKNANLCPASVLDRLNPLLEPGGSLLLVESVTESDSYGFHNREVTCSDNFRIFLSMDPEHGEISRAMRNRCVEIALLPGASSISVEFIDSVDSIWRSGIRSSLIASAMLSCKHPRSESNTANENRSSIASVGSCIASLWARGIESSKAMLLVSRIFKDSVSELQLDRHALRARHSFAPIPNNISGDYWYRIPEFASAGWDSRILRCFYGEIFSTSANNNRFNLNEFPFKAWKSQVFSESKFQLFHPFLRECDAVSEIRNNLLYELVIDTDDKNVAQIYRYFDRMEGNLKNSLRFVIFAVKKLQTYAKQIMASNIQVLNTFSWIQLDRIPQRLSELAWNEKLIKDSTTATIGISSTVLETSLFLFHEKLNENVCRCPLTPLMIPFFQELDNWIELSEQQLAQVALPQSICDTWEKLLTCRDALWQYLSETSFSTRKLGSWGFDETTFSVLYLKFRKHFISINILLDPIGDEKRHNRRLSALINSIDNVVYNTEEGIRYMGTSVLKHVAKPSVPRSTLDWTSWLDLRRISRQLNLELPNGSSNNSGCISLSDLLLHHHPILGLDPEMKIELLGAYSTMQLKFIEQSRPNGQSFKVPYSAPKIVDHFSSRLKRIVDIVASKVGSLQCNGDFETSTNSLKSVEDLELMIAGTVASETKYKIESEFLLTRFSELQVVPCVEYWCEQQENEFIASLCELLAGSSNERLKAGLMRLVPPIQRFVRRALSSTLWDIVDVGPFNTLIWIIEGYYENEGNDADFRISVCSLLSELLVNVGRRHGSSCLDHGRRISRSLELPSFFQLEDRDAVLGKTMHDPIVCRSRSQLHQDVPSAVIFALVGDAFTSAFTGTPISLSTLENYRTRHSQFRLVLQSLAFHNENVRLASNPSYVITYIAQDSLLSLRKTFPDQTWLELKAILEKYATDPSGIFFQEDMEVRRILSFSSNEMLQKLISPLILPLFALLKRLLGSDSNLQESKLDLAWAKIYAGLLRFHLVSPDSPLDPGKKPSVKIDLTKRRLSSVGYKAMVLHAKNIYLRKNLDPCAKAEKLVLDGESLMRKCQSQQTKLIIRPPATPPFVDLFREVRIVAGTALDVDTVLELANLLLNSGVDSKEYALHREKTWQSTASTFRERLLNNFNCYNDICGPMITAMDFIKEGLGYLSSSVVSLNASVINKTMSTFASFPMPEFPSSLDKLSAVLKSNKFRLEMSWDCKVAVACGILSILRLKSEVLGLNGEVLNFFKSILREIIDEPSTIGTTIATTAEDKQIEDVFPNHEASFLDLVEPSADDCDMNPFGSESTNQKKGLLRDDIVDLVSLLHQAIFNRNVGASDSSRLDTFRQSYAAACVVSVDVTSEDSPLQLYEETYGGHAMALSLFMPSTQDGAIQAFRPYSDPNFVPDFNKDSNPDVVVRCYSALESLIARVTKLLAVFPENAMLLAVARVVDKVKRFDIYSIALGKVMTGLEVILRLADDWEMHASNRVKLGKPLSDLSRIVSDWRQLELQSWQNLLISRERRYSKQARRHWIRIYSILQGFVDSCQSRQVKMDSSPCSVSKQWVWKGTKHVQSLLTISHDCPVELMDIVKALDTFCLTSPLGEIKERLLILQAYANQVEIEATTASDGIIFLARSLASLYNYYTHFLPILLAKSDEMKRPLEARLNQEVKLAKWDEQTYYAAAQSRARNHRKLFTILAEYDEALEYNVSVLLDNNICQGIRDNAVSGQRNGSSSSFPSTNAFFPFQLAEECHDAEDTNRSITQGDVHWSDGKHIGVSNESPLHKLEFFARKMSKIHFEMSGASSSASIGNSEVNEFCEAIFERLESLRSKKTTRPMKERALVDLFKELRRQGYATTRLSIPHQLSQLGEIFQLPIPRESDCPHKNLSRFRRAESYFHRSLSEMHRLRSEVSIEGSNHMTSTQLNLMTAFAEHGLLLLIQQRSLFAILLQQRDSLSKILQQFPSAAKSLPTGQSGLRNCFSIFKEHRVLAIESLSQLLLFLRSSSSLLDSEGKRMWTADAITYLKSLILSINDTRSQCPIIISQSHLEDVKGTIDIFSSAVGQIQLWCQTCIDLECLPVSGFYTCVSILQKTIALAELCLSHDPRDNVVDVKDSLGFGSFVESAEKALESALLAVQACANDGKINDLNGNMILCEGVWRCHRSSIESWGSIRMNRLCKSFEEVVSKLMLLHDDASIELDDTSCCVGMTGNLHRVYEEALNVVDFRLHEYCSFYGNTAKLQYVLLRVFRFLAAKGFCISIEKEDGADSNEGNPESTTFEDDNEGTGMGDGDGKQDVTEQLENEEQLLGLKNEIENDREKEKNDNKLDSEEAKKGMEMEADFEGDLFDVPDDQEDNNEASGDDEELDREMGNDKDDNEQVVDEKMWGDEDDKDNPPSADEKMEKDNLTEGAEPTDETTTKSENTQQDKQSQNQEPSAEANDSCEEKEGEDDRINNDSEDMYEDNHGVDVRADQEKNENENGAEDMDIDENMEIEEDSDHDNNSQSDNEENPAENGQQETCDPSNDPMSEETAKDDTNAEYPDASDEVDEDHPENDVNTDTPAPEITENCNPTPKSGLGVSHSDGTDVVENHEEEDARQQTESGETDQEVPDQTDHKPTQEDGKNFGAQEGPSLSDLPDKNASEKFEREKAPNPLKSHGDASKYWHEKVNIVQSMSHLPDDNEKDDASTQLDSHTGNFEFSQSNDCQEQALGEAEEKDVSDLNERENEGRPESEESDAVKEEIETKPFYRSGSRQHPVESNTENKENKHVIADDARNDNTDFDDEMDQKSQHSDSSQQEDFESDILSSANIVVSDMEQLQVERNTLSFPLERSAIIEEDQNVLTNMEELEAARKKWALIQRDTHALARRTCEKLRLVLEPLVATKLKGDYRTGKRINMKRVIGYIASGYRKDKIWLRRTKPAKRNYRVLLAVDDSESMSKTGAGDIALKAMAILTVAMSQLEVGEVGIASFGTEMHVVHPFHTPFTSESGALVVKNFRFNQQRTRMALCVESALSALEDGGYSASTQLVFIISDGRIERDSRGTLRRLIREMAERNILLVMIIVEGDKKNDNDRIISMKEVSFENGKPKVKRFIEDYPFPYYIILDDMQSLPEVLGDALRQWFEMLASLQG